MANLKNNEVVAGYMYTYSDERGNTLCQIVERAGTDEEQMDEPRFLVEFMDGERMLVDASDLHPWYVT